MSNNIITIEVRNFKRAEAVWMEPRPIGVTKIGGNNAQGKSSVLDAIISALAGDKHTPAQPLRAGTEHGHVEIVTDQYTIRKEFTPGGHTKLVVKDLRGVVVNKPQGLLSTLFDGQKPDITAFVRMKPSDQAEKLREILGIDTRPLDAERKRLFDTRTVVNRDAKDLEGAMKEMPVWPDVPETDLSITELVKSVQDAQDHNNKLKDKCREWEAKTVDLDTIKDRVISLKEQYEKAVSEYKAAKSDLDEFAAVFNASDRTMKDTSGLVAQMNDISQINGERAAHRSANNEQASAMNRFTAKRDEAERLTKQIEEIDRKKAKLLASVVFPVPGLSIDGDVVTLNGFPLEQASTAEKLRAGVLLYLASEPKLRWVPIYDGSFFDAESLAIIDQICTEQNCQVFLETVGDNGDCDYVIEDGTVKGADEE
jgi:DNA repair exonuclease SbcCD ATPase subunit